MTAREILDRGFRILETNPATRTRQNVVNIRIAARFAWEREEMGGKEHLDFAYRNGTPIVPPGHCGHPLELVKRGYVDGKGWPDKTPGPDLKFFRWPNGKHWYATADGVDVFEGGNQKWNTMQDAEAAAKRFAKKNLTSVRPCAKL